MSRDHDRPHVIAALGKASFYGLTNYPQAPWPSPLKNEEASIERLLLAPQPDLSTAAMLLPSFTLSARAANVEAKSSFPYTQK